eukprot:2348702-Prymnesium_polylepis.2
MVAGCVCHARSGRGVAGVGARARGPGRAGGARAIALLMDRGTGSLVGGGVRGRRIWDEAEYPQHDTRTDRTRGQIAIKLRVTVGARPAPGASAVGGGWPVTYTDHPPCSQPGRVKDSTASLV